MTTTNENTCLPFVNWLTSWFKPKTQDYHYLITSNGNVGIGNNLLITITVTDGNGNTVPNHEFTLNLPNGTTTLTTDSNGVATHTYTADSFGIKTFRVNDTQRQIKVGGSRSVASTNFTVYEYEDYVMLYASRSYSLTNSSSWQQSLAIPSSVTPLNNVYTATSHRSVNARATTTGHVELLNTSGSAISSTSIQFQLMWRK